MKGIFITSKHTKTIQGGHFESDFFVLLHGTSPLKGEIAARFAVETAIWGYTHIRQRHYYWVDKKKLLLRILRSTNIALWQKQKDPGYTEKLQVEGVIGIIGAKKMWIACIGNASVYEKRESKEWRIMGKITGNVTKRLPLGADRYALSFESGIIPFVPNDRVILTVGAAANLEISDMKIVSDALDMRPQDGEKYFETLCTDDPIWGACIFEANKS